MALIAKMQRLWVRLLGNHLIVGLVPVLLVAGVLVYTARSALEQAVLDSHQQVARRAAKEVQHFLDQPIASLKVLAQSMNVVHDSWRRQSLLSQVGLELDAVAELCFVDTTGLIQATNVLDVHALLQRGERLPPGYVPHARVLWSAVKREEFYASEVIQHEGQPSLFIGLAVKEGDQVVGALIARFALYEIWQQVDQIRLGDTGRGILLDARGRYIAFPSRQDVYLDDPHPEFAPHISGNGTRQWRDFEGREWVAGFARIEDWGWTVVVRQEAQEAFGLVAMMQHRAIWITVASVAGAVLLGLLLLRSITRPINRLMHTVRAVQAGEAFALELPAIKDELWELGQAFTEMNQVLEARKAQLEAELNFSDRLIEDNPLAIAVVDQQRTVRANNSWYQLFGADRGGDWAQTAEGRQLLDWIEHNPKTREGDSLEIKCPQGGTRFWNLKVVDLERALPGHLLLVIDDQTQRKLLELHYGQSEKLASLGEMAAGVAHEIKNPLAIIRHAYELLAQIVPQGVEGRDQALRPLGAAIGRINERVANLLDFARPTQQMQELVDPTVILRQLVDLEQKHAEHLGIAIEASLGEVSSVLVNRDMLKDVFLNLTSNAFAAMPDGGKLLISAEQQDDWVVVVVGDTGTGIPQKHIRQIFEPFYSTKPPGQGTGLGLAIVHRQLQEIGGRVEVESVPDQGTRFSLYLPIANSERQD